MDSTTSTMSVKDMPSPKEGLPEQPAPAPSPRSSAARIASGLGWIDRLLPLLIFIAIVLGIVIGKYAKDVDRVLEGASLNGVSIPIVVGLLVMMWPILTKVQYERFPAIFSSWHIWKHIAWSLLINWIIAPFVMLALAFATLPDQPTFRDGVILVGIARCIAMVMIWSTLAGGDTNYCAILVIINSVLQMVLFSPMSLLFINVISKGSIRLQYGKTAIDVLIYLGIPLVAGVVTRFAMRALLGEKRFEGPFLTWFSPLALLGLLYTIILICMQQATRILSHIGIVFRVMVPLALYFTIMWSLVFALFNWLSRKRGIAAGYDYDKAVVQSFTAASNNFELAIAVAVAVFGVGSDQALAATLGPMVEVPVLLALTYLSVWFQGKLRWGTKAENEAAAAAGQPAPV